MIILDLCGGTGAWSKPYADAGYDVRILDMPNNDVRLKTVTEETIYGVLAAPPCTHFSGSGARWWKSKGNAALMEGLSIVDACLRIIMIAKPVFWALENPVGRLVHYLGKPKMYFDPCDYGDPYTKKTCLWGEFNIPIKTPVKPVGKNPIWYMPPSKNRSQLRSITPPPFCKSIFQRKPRGQQ